MPKSIRIDVRLVWDRLALDRAFDALSDADETSNDWDEVANDNAAASVRS